MYGSEITYLDPYTGRRVDGLEAMQVRLAAMKTAKLRFHDPWAAIVDLKVQRLGDVAVLKFNLENYGKTQDQPESGLPRWNSTEIYA